MKSWIIIVLCLCLAVSVTACLKRDDSKEPVIDLQQSSSVGSVETSSEIKENNQETDRTNATTESNKADSVIPITYNPDEWELQGFGWIESTKLIAVFCDKTSGSEITKKSVVLYNLSDCSEQALFSFSDSGWLGDIRSNGNEILITTSEKVYTIKKPELTSLDASMDKGRDWGADTFGGLSADRDDTGIIIKTRDNPTQTIRVATQTEEYFFDSPRWSPDGQYILYNKYFGGVGDPINLCVADKNGNSLCEFKIPEYDYGSYWSSNSRYIMVIANKEHGGTTRLLDIETGKEIATLKSPYADYFADCRDVYEETAVYWRQNGEADDYTIYTFDALTGSTTDIVTMDTHSDIKFSPDGSLLAVIEKPHPSKIQFYNSDVQSNK